MQLFCKLSRFSAVTKQLNNTYLLLPMKKTLLFCAGLFVISTTALSQNLHPGSAKELELHRIQNIQSGNPADAGIFNKLIITFEDYSLYEKNSEKIQQLLGDQISITSSQNNSDARNVEIVYPLVEAKTDGFLKMFKETAVSFGVLIYEYQEQLVLSTK